MSGRDEHTPKESLAAHIREELAKQAEKHRSRAKGLMELIRDQELVLTHPLKSNPRRAAALRNARNLLAHYDYQLGLWSSDETVTIDHMAREQHEFLALITFVVAALEGT